MINYKLHTNDQHMNLYMLIIYITHMKCAYIIMNHHLQLDVECNFINFTNAFIVTNVNYDIYSKKL
jgi:hypothetical protein